MSELTTAAVRLHLDDGKAYKRFRGSRFSIFPLIGAAVWFSMLWSMMIIWISQHQPRYSHVHSDQRMAFISDIGSNVIKPFFIAGCSVTAVTFSVSLFSVRRKSASSGKAERFFDVLSIIAGIFGSVGLVLLSVFDLACYRSVHIVSMVLFMTGIILSASSDMREYCNIGKHYEDFEILRVISFAKTMLIGVEITLVICLAGFTIGKWYTSAIITEWACAYVYTFYILSYFFDLGPVAITKNQAELLQVLNSRRSSTPIFGSPRTAEAPLSQR